MRPTTVHRCPICHREIREANLSAPLGQRVLPPKGPGRQMRQHLAGHERRGDVAK